MHVFVTPFLYSMPNHVKPVQCETLSKHLFLHALSLESTVQCETLSTNLSLPALSPENLRSYHHLESFRRGVNFSKMSRYVSTSPDNSSHLPGVTCFTMDSAMFKGFHLIIANLSWVLPIAPIYMAYLLLLTFILLLAHLFIQLSCYD